MPNTLTSAMVHLRAGVHDKRYFVQMWIDLIGQFIELCPFLTEFRRLMRRVQQLATLPLDVVDDAPAIQAAVQADRDESWLGRHKAGALSHERQGFSLLARLGFDDCDLGYRLIV